MISIRILVFILFIGGGFLSHFRHQTLRLTQPPPDSVMSIRYDSSAHTLHVYLDSADMPFVTQDLPINARPATDFTKGNTSANISYSLRRVNDTELSQKDSEKYWKLSSVNVIKENGAEVKWQLAYEIVDSSGKPLLKEFQDWSLTSDQGELLTDIEWQIEALQDLEIDSSDAGGISCQLSAQSQAPKVVNAARQINNQANRQPSMWIDAGWKTKSTETHFALLDHPENEGYPQEWKIENNRIDAAYFSQSAKSLKKGEALYTRHRVINYQRSFNDVEMNTLWSRFSGMDMTYDLWDIARQEGKDAKFLSPKEAVEAMTIKDGYAVNVWASEPLMSQPMAFCWDDRGRLWVAENLDYESRGDGFSNSGESRILILEDTNHDGTADTRKVFLEGIAFPAALAVGFDGLFLGAPPNLLFVPDKNHDDQADAEIEIRLTGWGIRDRHETLNSFHWGPDGWLYGTQGFATPSLVGKSIGTGQIYHGKDPFPKKIDVQNGAEINGGVWRYHPVKDTFEVIANGFSNPWGVDHDAKGQIFITACVIPHLWFIVPGGIYQRQGGQHFNPYVYEDIKTIADHSHRSAHGGAQVYLSDAFPESERGKIFMCNIHEHAILTDTLIREGSGFIGKHSDEFLMANNAQWVGFSLQTGPDGSIYALDWHDADICGTEVLHKNTGRIFRVAPKETHAKPWPGRYGDLSKLPDEALVDLHLSPSEWHARRASLVLQNRANHKILRKNTAPSLRKILADDVRSDHRLRALWTLYSIGAAGRGFLLSHLDDIDEYMRSWAVRLLGDDFPNDTVVREKLIEMAKNEPSPVARLYLTSVCQKIAPKWRFELLASLLQHAEDTADHNIPNMLWFALEPLVANNPKKALEISVAGKIPKLVNFVSRRAAESDSLNSVIFAAEKFPEARLSILSGMKDALSGRYDVKAPANWRRISASLKKSGGEITRLVTEIDQNFSNTETGARSISTLKNPKASISEKLNALNILSHQQRPELKTLLPGLLADSALKLAAIRAIASFHDDSLGKLLISLYPKFDTDEKSEAVLTLSSRPKYGWQLTQAIAAGNIPKKEVPVYVARQLRRVVGSGFVEVWGPIDEFPKNQAAFEKYRNLLSDANLKTADARTGALIFRQSCGACHVLNGEGGRIGPDLTGSNRTNVDYLLNNILNPSGDIQDDYKMVVITTRDGRTYVGNVASENGRQLTVRVIGQNEVILNLSQIQSRETTPASLMPEGLLEPLSDKEILDLVAYLRSANPPNPGK